MISLNLSFFIEKQGFMYTRTKLFLLDPDFLDTIFRIKSVKVDYFPPAVNKEKFIDRFSVFIDYLVFQVLLVFR